MGMEVGYLQANLVVDVGASIVVEVRRNTKAARVVAIEDYSTKYYGIAKGMGSYNLRDSK